MMRCPLNDNLGLDMQFDQIAVLTNLDRINQFMINSLSAILERKRRMRMIRAFALAVAIVGSAASFVPQVAHAAGSASAAPVLIDKVTVENGIYYLFASNFTNPDNCASAAVLVILPSLAKQDSYFSMALTAVTARKPLQIWVSGCTPTNWYASAPIVQSLTIVGN
jgi:hypothetical protein